MGDLIWFQGEMAQSWVLSCQADPLGAMAVVLPPPPPRRLKAAVGVQIQDYLLR